MGSRENATLGWCKINNKIAGYIALERLEPCAGKLACTVLRGADNSNVVGLLDFCFVARQKRISVGRDDYYIDLLLYNRYLKRLVVIELKTTHFKPAHKGQMELYLNWLNEHERQPDEDSPLGIILCTEKDKEVVKLFDLAANNIHVAQYLTVLPPKEVFEKKLQDIVNKAKEIYPFPEKTEEEE